MDQRWLQTSTPSIASTLLQANHKSALTNTKFVDCSIKELLENHCIHMVTSRPHIFSPMSVVTNREGKKRLVLNLRYLNNFLLKERSKYEDIKVAISSFRTVEYVFMFDLKLGYHHISIANHIRIEPEWIPRSEKQLADYLSRIVDYNDWCLDASIFQYLEQRWGPHTVDRFADYYNTQLPCFNSTFWNPGTEAVDTFTCDWGKDNNWFCPPVYLIPRMIMHARRCCAVGTLLAPECPSTPIWPILYPDGKVPTPFITDVVVLSNTKSYSALEHACTKALQIQNYGHSLGGF